MTKQLDYDKETLIPAESTDTPAVIPAFPHTHLPAGTGLETAQGEDAQKTSFIFNALGFAWGQARTVDDICRLALVTCKVMKERRDLLGLPNAHKTSKSEQYVVYPLD